MRRAAIALPILSLFFAAGAQADVLYDNLAFKTDTGQQVSAVGPLGDSFSTLGTPFLFTDVTLRLFAQSEGDGGSLTVNLLSDDPGSVSAVVLATNSITDLTIGSVFRNVDVSFTPTALAANTRYWIELVQSSGSAFWDLENDDSGTRVAGESFYASHGIFPNSDGPYIMAIGSTGVPEPLTLSLFGAGLVGAVVLRRRRAG